MAPLYNSIAGRYYRSVIFLPQTVLLQVNSGSGLTSSQASQLASLAATLSSYGVFSSDALINAPGGSGGGSATIENQRAMLNYLYALLSEII